MSSSFIHVVVVWWLQYSLLRVAEKIKTNDMIIFSMLREKVGIRVMAINFCREKSNAISCSLRFFALERNSERRNPVKNYQVRKN